MTKEENNRLMNEILQSVKSGSKILFNPKEQNKNWVERFDELFIKNYDVEGCQEFSDKCGKKEGDKWICYYCQKYGGQQRTRQGLDISEEKIKSFISSLLKEKDDIIKQCQEKKFTQKNTQNITQMEKTMDHAVRNAVKKWALK